jgi:hypothetical protein
VNRIGLPVSHELIMELATDKVDADQDSRRRKARWQIKDNWYQFCNKTTLHGWTYIGEVDKGIFHKCFWAASIAIGIACTGIMMVDTLEEFGEDPVLTTIDSFTYPVERVQYPTVAVCPPQPVAHAEYSEWLFLRTAWNLVKFQCDDEASCKETSLVRNDFSDFLHDSAELILKKTPLPDGHGIAVKMVLRHINKKIEGSGNATLVSEVVIRKVYERLSSMLDDTLYEYLNTSRNQLENAEIDEILNDTSDNVVDPHFILARDATKALAYPVMVGLGEMLYEFQNLLEGNGSAQTIQQLMSRLGLSSDFPLNKICKNLYHIYGSYGKRTSHLAKDSKFMSDIVTCNGMSMKRQPVNVQPLLAGIKTKYPLQEEVSANNENIPYHCEFQAGKEKPCRFLPVPTDWNICMAFNAASPADNFRAPKFVNALYSAFNISNDSYKIVNNHADLTTNRMTMVLDKNRWGDTEQDDFIVDVNAKYDYFDVTTNGNVRAKVGYETTVLVTPRELVSKANMDSLRVQDRNCRYLNENPRTNSLFRQFTQKSCDFEAKYLYARERHGCSPWFLPTEDNYTGSYCSRGETKRFQNTMAEFRRNTASPRCVENCNEVDFDVVVTSNPIDPNEACNVRKIKLLGMNRDSEWRKHEERQLAWRLENDRGDSFCHYKTRSHLAFVSIEITTPRIMRIARRRRVSFADMLGNVGKEIVLTSLMI